MPLQVLAEKVRSQAAETLLSRQRQQPAAAVQQAVAELCVFASACDSS